MIKKINSKLSKERDLKEILGGGAVTFALNMIGMLLGYIVVIIISHNYGAEGVGLYSLMLSFLTFFAMLASMGTTMSVLRYVGQFNTYENKQNLKILYRYLLELVVPLSLLFAVIIYFASGFIAVHLFDNSKYTNGLIVGAFVIPFMTLLNVNVEYIRGLKRLKYSEFLRSVNRHLFNIAFLLIAWLFFKTELVSVFINSNLVSMLLKRLALPQLIDNNFLNLYIDEKLVPLYSLYAAIIVTSLLSVIAVYRNIRNKFSSSLKTFTRKELISTSLPMLVITIASFILGNIGLFFLEMFTTTEQVGVFSIAFKISLVAGMILMVINTIAAPKFSEMYWSNELDKLQKILFFTSKLNVIFSFIPAAIIIIFSKQILSIFGHEFVQGQIILIILTIEQFINASTGSAGLLLNMAGQQSISQKIIVFTLIISLGLNITLIPLYGMYGAALSILASSLFMRLSNVYYLKKKLGMSTINLLSIMRLNYVTK
jgi:O-antigen/teichoic acid export membrane protein